jgi:hypothetical protein
MTELEQLQAKQKEAEDLVKLAEACRVTHEKKGFDTNPIPDAIDYGTCGQVAELAMQHLDEAVPNGQRARAEAAYKALSAAVTLYGLWLRKKGLTV